MKCVVPITCDHAAEAWRCHGSALVGPAPRQLQVPHGGAIRVQSCREHDYDFVATTGTSSVEIERLSNISFRGHAAPIRRLTQYAAASKS
jgi:hypothetical protein